MNGDLYKLHPDTGAEILNYSLPFHPGAIATDGTYFYISCYEWSPANGTIFKYQIDGFTYVDTLSVPVTTYCVGGLAFDGTYLWATLDDPINSLFRINLNTGNVEETISVTERYDGLTWYNGLLWGTNWQNDEIHALNPSSGRIQEVFNNPVTGSGDFGLGFNGTHFLMSDWNLQNIYFMDIPTAVGEVWNQYNSPSTYPLGIAWNGSHYFNSDRDDWRIYVIHDGTFQVEYYFDLPFEPCAVELVGDYLYISELFSNNIYGYTQAGVMLGMVSTCVMVGDLAWDGSSLWVTDLDGSFFIYEIDQYTGDEVSNYSVGVSYAGLCYDSINNVFWAVDWNYESKIIQLNPSDFTPTGIELPLPATYGEFALTFNGEHLIHTNWDTAIIYKIIIDLPSDGGGIPGFANYFFLLSVIILIGIVIFLRQSKNYLQKI